MLSISAKVLRDAEWKECYNYSSPTMRFKVYSSKIPGVTITHDFPVKGHGKTKIYYTVNGAKTDSPTRAVRLYNEAQKRRRGERHASGSPESIAAIRRNAGL